jgi:tRNA pseudouridine55 synthase
MVSAIKVGGRRLYDLAREGTEVEREARSVEIHELEILDVGPPPYPEVEMRVRCGKGAYIRSLADDIARALGGGAHLIALRRAAVGALTLDDAVPLDDLETAWQSAVVSPSRGLAHLPEVTVGPEVAESVLHGARFAHRLHDTAVDGPFRVLDGDGRLLAVYRNAEQGSRAEVVLG